MDIILQGHATNVQILGFLRYLSLFKKDIDPSIVAACSQSLRHHSRLVPFDTDHDLVDIVGTGGDGHDTFNVSTTAAIVAAGAGAKVTKNGSRASCSKSGSADLMDAYGCDINAVTPDQVPVILGQVNFCFLFSGTYLPNMTKVRQARKELGEPTVFNTLGPLSNPAQPRRMVVGVHSMSLGDLMVDALQLDGVRNALVVCGKEGLDEYWRLHENGNITRGTLHPTDNFGLDTHLLSKVKGGDCEENANILRQLLDNQLPHGHPILDFVLINTAALLVVGGIAMDYKDGVIKARESIESGKAKAVLDSFKKITIQLRQQQQQ
ncbi:anthranilate phosphoribosyltransferase [Chlamydoabsidia padenii]|nr:anthranilate phosphoribosyltransferase [Chlamydoabsidia padenii]